MRALYRQRRHRAEPVRHATRSGGRDPFLLGGRSRRRRDALARDLGEAEPFPGSAGVDNYACVCVANHALARLYLGLYLDSSRWGDPFLGEGTFARRAFLRWSRGVPEFWESGRVEGG